MESPKLRAASYGRQSTADQHTILTQLKLCRKLIEERGWRETHRLSDNALKGRDPTRPGYQRLVQLIEDQRIDVIVTWRFDRLFRSLKEASIAHEHADQHGVSFVSVTEPFDTTTSIGRFLFGNLANFAQFETDLLKERANLGYERRVNEGRWTGAHPPYGYTKDTAGKLTVMPEEAATIHLMFRAYKRIGGDRRLAQYLNHNDRMRRGRPWTTDQVRRAMTHPLLQGTLTQRGNTQQHPELAIITPRQVRTHLAHRKSLHGTGIHDPKHRDETKLDEILQEYLATLEADTA